MPSGYTFDSSHGPGVGMSSAGSSGSGSSGNIISRARETVANMASNISNIAKTNTSMLGDKVREILQNPASSASQASVYNIMDNGFDMDEYYDLLMDLAGYNNTWSEKQASNAMNFENQQAERQMNFQWKSDQAAMAWSAAEAAKERAWSKELSDNAHRREVKDLLAAGLNPILAAHGGAWAGSGASGSGYSASGAKGTGLMGQTDMSTAGVIGSLMSNQMTTARDMAVSKLQADTQKYNTDMNYAIAKMQAETSIYNNNTNIDANKAIRALDRDADIKKAGISAGATRDAAAMSAGAITSAAYTQAEAAKYGYDVNSATQRFNKRVDADLEKYKHDNPSGSDIYKTEHNPVADPVSYAEHFMDKAMEVDDLITDFLNRSDRQQKKLLNNYNNTTYNNSNSGRMW